jgi:hypothetical protein
MTVVDIIVDFLKSNGYDGLVGDGCGCTLDDFMPCGNESCLGCVPGIVLKVICGDCASIDDCEAFTGDKAMNCVCVRETYNE